MGSYVEYRPAGTDDAFQRLPGLNPTLSAGQGVVSIDNSGESSSGSKTWRGWDPPGFEYRCTCNTQQEVEALVRFFQASVGGSGREPAHYNIRHPLTRAWHVETVQVVGRLSVPDAEPYDVSFSLVAVAGQGVPARSEERRVMQGGAVTTPPIPGVDPAVGDPPAEPEPGGFVAGVLDRLDGLLGDTLFAGAQGGDAAAGDDGSTAGGGG